MQNCSSGGLDEPGRCLEDATNGVADLIMMMLMVMMMVVVVVLVMVVMVMMMVVVVVVVVVVMVVVIYLVRMVVHSDQSMERVSFGWLQTRH